VIPRRYLKLKQVLDRRQPDLTVITEDIHKPHNFSAIIRTCDAVGILDVHAVNVEGETPIYPQITQGSEKWVKLHVHEDIQTAIRELQQRQYRVYAAHLSDGAIDYRQVDYTKPTAILLGNERTGVSETSASLVDGHIIIPMLGMVQSLNVSVAAAVILFEAQRQRIEAGSYDRSHLTPEIYDRTLFEWCYPEVATLYRQKNLPYPALNELGEIVSK
jgi:tRNA (guanosine-2'-O-)-methyltransferase